MIYTYTRHFLGALHCGANGALGFLHGRDFAELDATGPGCRRSDDPEPRLARKRANRSILAEPSCAVKAQNETSDFGTAHVQDRDHSALQCLTPHLAHGALRLIKICHPTAPRRSFP